MVQHNASSNVFESHKNHIKKMAQTEALMFMGRLQSDWDRLPLGLKKAWTAKDAMTVHASCAGFIAILEALKNAIPQADFAREEPQLRQQFQLSYLDPDIVHFLESTVPPVQLTEVNFVRRI